MEQYETCPWYGTLQDTKTGKYLGLEIERSVERKITNTFEKLKNKGLPKGMMDDSPVLKKSGIVDGSKLTLLNSDKLFSQEFFYNERLKVIQSVKDQSKVLTVVGDIKNGTLIELKKFKNLPTQKFLLKDNKKVSRTGISELDDTIDVVADVTNVLTLFFGPTTALIPLPYTDSFNLSFYLEPKDGTKDDGLYYLNIGTGVPIISESFKQQSTNYFIPKLDKLESILSKKVVNKYEALENQINSSLLHLSKDNKTIFKMKRSLGRVFECNIPDIPILAECPTGYNNALVACESPTPKDDNRPADCFTIYHGTIKSKHNNKCITTQNANLILSTCINKTTQNFYYDNTTNKIFINNNRSKCLTIQGGIVKGSKIIISNSNNSINQKFTYDPYQLIFRAIGSFRGELVIATNGSNIFLEEYVYNRNKQRWNFAKDTNNSWTNNGANCALGVRSKTADFGLGKYETADCPVGATNFGSLCNNTFTRDTYYGVGIPWTKDLENCRKVYKNEIAAGWGDCNTDSGHFTRPSCKLEAAKRYGKNGKPGEYINTGLFCQMSSKIGRTGICPPKKGLNTQELKDSVHYKKMNTEFGYCYVDCEEKYGKGYYFNGTTCWKDPKVNIGFGDMKCLADEFKKGARCYKECPKGGTNTGLGLCTLGSEHMKCPEGRFKTDIPILPGGICFKETEPRFVNAGFHKKMFKRRKIPYSTTNN